MSFLRLDNVKKQFGQHSVINGVSLEAQKGEFVVFVGPSGCGKSTLLRMIAGLEDISSGDISIDNAVVTHMEPARREVAMVFQSYALYPHMSVFENMAFGLRMVKMSEAEITKQVNDAARILQIEPLLKRKPRELSGGQRQRVAIGRAIVRHPKLFLFDEPLSNLDAELRTQMRVEIAKLHRDLNVSMIYVTHDQIEAMTLADRIVVLRAGQVEQIGSPTELYDRPCNMFVAGFIGSPKMNFLNCQVAAVREGQLTLTHPSFVGGSVSAVAQGAGRIKAGDKVSLGLRPEHLELGGNAPILSGEVDFVENLGGATQIYFKLGDGEGGTVLAAGRPVIGPGDRLPLSISPQHLHVFDSNGLRI
jgi:lactose/L-arabinose transport system ATP-binding protein